MPILFAIKAASSSYGIAKNKCNEEERERDGEKRRILKNFRRKKEEAIQNVS
jgi:hypothetical protein